MSCCPTTYISYKEKSLKQRPYVKLRLLLYMSESMKNIKDDWIWLLETSGCSVDEQGTFEWASSFKNITDV